MIYFFSSLRGLLKFESVRTDNSIFRLHYKATAIILFVFSLIISSRQYIVSNRTQGRIGVDFLQPGVSSYVKDEDKVVHHKYYQWVCFVLFFQAVAFYLPRFMWKTWEGGRIKSLVMELDNQLIEEEEKNYHKDQLINYFTTNMHMHNYYAFRFFFCEFANFFNVIFQMYFTDYFLGGEFSTYGIDVFKFSEMEPEQRNDPMSVVFPKIAKCSFQKYGPSGTIQTLDGLCLLSLNIANEKIYVFLWFWFMFLAILSSLNILYRMAVVLMPEFRLHLLSAKSRLTSRDKLEKIVNKCKIGDWFVLYQVGKNINPMIFKELLSDLANKLGNKDNV